MAGSRIKGITVEIGGDTTKLQTALKGGQFRNQEYAKSAQGCRKAPETGSRQHRATCAEAEVPLQRCQ